MARLTAWARLGRARWGRRARGLARRWRSSLQLQVLTSTLAIGLVALAVIGAYVSERTSAGLFEDRLGQVLEESARSTQQVQDQLSASPASTSPEVALLLEDVTTQQRNGGSGERDVFLLRAPGQNASIAVGATATDSTLVALVSRDLKQAVADGGQHWQSVGIPTAAGSTHPGIVVGQQVDVPLAGTYQMFFLYSLQPEQERLDFLLGTLALAAVAVVALLGAMTWSVTRRTVDPVRRAAHVAERLADGHLSERMVVHGRDEMATLARTFNEMAESLQDQIHRMEELSTLQRRFVSDVSHELRTPLTTIRMAGELIHGARDDFEPSVKRSAELLATQLDRFEDLLADLLEISRFDAGAAVLDAEGRDLRDIVVQAVDNAVPLAVQRGSWLRVDLPDTRADADVDPRRVERILRNLLVNGIEHADGSAVEVTVGVDASAVAVTVRDHGVGMTAQEAEHVFDRFWRADPARARTTGGTGLGLAISLEDAHLHGGTLEAWGRPGHGACFRLTLPRRAGIRLTGSPLPLQPEPEASPAVEAGPRRSTDPVALPELPPMTGEIAIVSNPTDPVRTDVRLDDAGVPADVRGAS
ncbi:HAMP domain-containing histidine kinase [Cellulomonas sp. zg-ZUI222]|uniref:Sensor histidine kinase MtrB n=1 Tax=Cellulomonas wangleii TaxID=2816956 RepID=A0ABX8D603_9CELL|nr:MULTISPECIES: MtrAB system histidine kinase MtrB [Cellulomonas]MBO0899891.1 HAMP domain-containing histidine kinase [Cellulomonas sp. zg-ZUI22]MBO0921195.1 HAMP domain-containing histidine kinase [Cellulomonas wangleii]MBO0925323.1 HAMP domain-containing histidine kinase [Cellulomonas wangleii]QVI61182.1 HAMP domain-containing histidine kinase [Cellulomonas wangleii]